MCKITRFYGLSFDQQLQMRFSVWLAYLHNLATLEREQVGMLTTVVEPVVWAALIAPTEKRKKGIDAIKKLLSLLKRGLSHGHVKSVDGKQDIATSRAVSLQIAKLVRDRDARGKVTFKKKDDMVDGAEKDNV